MASVVKLIGFSPLNPIPFFQVKTIDFAVNFPILDNEIFGSSNFYKVSEFPYSFNWLTENLLPMQYMHKGTVVVTKYNCRTGVTSSIASGTNITPTGFALNYTVRKMNWNLTEGEYILYIAVTYDGTTEYYRSAVIEVKTTLPECLKIDYAHSDNTFNFVFVNDSEENIFIGTLYVEGTMDKVLPGNTLDTYDDDRGELELLQATPQRLYEIQLGPLPRKYIEKLNMILSCDQMYVNDIRVQAKEIIDVENLENNLGCMITLKVNQKEWEYMDEGYYDKFVIEGLAYSDDGLIETQSNDTDVFVVS